MQTADDNNKVCYFRNALVINIFKLVLHFNSTVINSQIRHYLTTNRRNFLETQYGFQYADSLPWLVAERAFTRDSIKIKPGT